VELRQEVADHVAEPGGGHGEDDAGAVAADHAAEPGQLVVGRDGGVGGRRERHQLVGRRSP